jgi:hypothetical protein
MLREMPLISQGAMQFLSAAAEIQAISLFAMGLTTA